MPYRFDVRYAALMSTLRGSAVRDVVPETFDTPSVEQHGARPRIVAILPRGEAIRNFVYSGALDILQKSTPLTVISVIPTAQLFSELAARYHHVLPLEARQDPYPIRLVRELIDIAHGRHVWSVAARERWRLRDEEAKTQYQRLKRFGRKALALPFASERGVKLLEGVETAASAALSRGGPYSELFRQLHPTLLFNGSHVHSQNALQAVHAARALGIPTVAFIFSWDNLTSQGRIIPAYDYYLVWNDLLRQQLLDIYQRVSPERVIVTGTPQFDFHFRPELYWTKGEFCKRVGAEPKRPLVLYSTGMANHMRGEPSIVEQIASMLATMHDVGAPQLLVRIYPKDRSGRFDELKRRRPDILMPDTQWIDAWLTPTNDDTQFLTNTLRHVDLGINVASTISLELCMFDKPVVNVGYDPPNGESVEVPFARYYEFDHYRPIVVSGAVSVASSPEHLAALVRDALTSPARRRLQRAALMHKMFGKTLDGGCAARIADVLARLARKCSVMNRRESPLVTSYFENT